MLPISLLVLTHDEERVIGRCLGSAPFAAEKLVVDSGSSDRTAEIAAAAGARVIHQEWLGYSRQRVAAADAARFDWILFLDADEWLPPALVAELEALLPGVMASELSGVRLLRTATYMGAPLRWYRPMVRERKDRLYHRARARWTETTVHEKLLFSGPHATAREPFLHDPYASLYDQYLRLARYGEMKAQERFAMGRRASALELPLVFALSFLKKYVLQLGILDGVRGGIVCHMEAHYEAYKSFRLHEMARWPGARSGTPKNVAFTP
jgi:glycosyltransferase involved in cell wall biosynthesis